jgi:ketosteroid isomerase-like protein
VIGLYQTCIATATFLPIGPLRLCAASPPDARTEVLNVDAAYQRAVLHADVTVLEAILADDILIVHSDGGTDDKKNFLDAISSGRLKMRSFERSHVEIRVHGSTVLLLSQTRKTFDYQGRPGEDHDTSVVTFMKQGGRWRIVAMQNTHLPAETR